MQVGGAGNDSFAAVAARDDTVTAVGATDAGVSKPTVGLSDVLAATAATADGAIRSTGQVGSPGADGASAVTATDSGSLLCGSTTGELGRAPAGATGSADAFCTVMTAAGTIDSVDQVGSRDEDRALGASFSPQQAWGFVSGSTSGLFPGAQDPTGGGLGNGDIVLSRIDDRGRADWSRQFGTDGNDVGAAVVTTQDGDGVVTGSTDGTLRGTAHGLTDGFLVRFDPSGGPRWMSQFGSAAADISRAVAVGGEASRGTEVFAVAGSTAGAPGGAAAGSTDVMVASFGTAGEQRWITQFGSPGADDGAGVVIDGDTVYVTGTTAGTFVAPAGQSGDPVVSAGARDGFLAAIDTETGNLRWVTQFGSPGNDDPAGLTRTEDGLLVVTGTTDGQLGETPSAGGTDGFLVAFRLPSAGGAASSKV